MDKFLEIDERRYLKVKIKSLATEAKIIREETKRARRWSIKRGLYHHRIGIVRNEARHTLIAYGFLRDKDYRTMEPNAKEAPDWTKVRKMVEKYGSHCDYSTTMRVKSDNANDPCSWDQYKKHLEDVLKRFDEWVVKAQIKVESAT